jgi:hypothetical protein
VSYIKQKKEEKKNKDSAIQLLGDLREIKSNYQHFLPNYQPNQTPQEQLGMSEYAHFVLIVADQQHQHFQKIHSRHHITYKGRSSNKSISKRPSAN